MDSKFKKLTPDLMVGNVPETVLFYTGKLGFKLNMAVPENEKIIEQEITSGKEYVYAMVSRGDVFLMFMRKDVYVDDIPALKGMPVGASASFYFDVDNVNLLYGLYKEAGVDIIKDISTTWYGMTEFYIRDCNGYILGFAEMEQ